MGKRKGLWKAFREGTKPADPLEEAYQNILKKRKESEKEDAEKELKKKLQEMVNESDVDSLLDMKTNVNEIYQLLVSKTEENPIEKLALAVTVESTRDVEECFVGFEYSVRLIVDGEEIHKLRYMLMWDACFVSEIASRKRLNALSRTKSYANYLQLSIESLAMWGNESWLPKQFEITEDIRTPKGFMDYSELPVG